MALGAGAGGAKVEEEAAEAAGTHSTRTSFITPVPVLPPLPGVSPT